MKVQHLSPPKSLGNLLMTFTHVKRTQETRLKRNNGEISVLVYRKPTHTDQYLHWLSPPNKLYRKVLFPPCLIEHIPLSQIKMTYITRSKARYQESIISKIFKRITYNHSTATRNRFKK